MYPSTSSYVDTTRCSNDRDANVARALITARALVAFVCR